MKEDKYKVEIIIMMIKSQQLIHKEEIQLQVAYSLYSCIRLRHHNHHHQRH